MKIYSIETGFFKLDGGAIFGVVPKTLWSGNNPPDENNRVDLAIRCMLIENKDKLILIDTGIGDKQSEKFFSYLNQFGEHNLEKSLNKYGFKPEDITDVFITHMHFDHIGGGVRWSENKTKYEATFKNAKYWTTKEHLEWAINPNSREKASFLKENIMPLVEGNYFNFIDFGEENIVNSSLGFQILKVNGHTESQMIPIIDYKGKKIVFMADFIPTTSHIPIPYVMGYDVRPLETIKEKEIFLKAAVENNFLLFFEHDPYFSMCTVKYATKGIVVDEKFQFEDVFI